MSSGYSSGNPELTASYHPVPGSYLNQPPLNSSMSQSNPALDQSAMPPPFPSQQPTMQSLLSHYPASRFTHLPTPQSPGIYTQPGPPESPLASTQSRLSSQSGQSSLGAPFQQTMNDMPPPPLASGPFMITPDSSPYAQRTAPQQTFQAPATPAASSQAERTPEQANAMLPPSTPKNSTIPMTLESPITITPSTSRGDSLLSSPFVPMEKRETPHRSPADTPSPPTPSMILSEEAFARATDISRNPTPLPPPAGGELERIRQARQRAMEEQIQHQREAENRRPEYLKRQKRTLAEADPSAYEDERTGIYDSPQKGRRIKLFQETSEESFEESLMAGGYGRYRTAEWVRQPQPMVVPPPKSSTPVSAEHSPQPPASTEPPSEKEIIKRKRLAAFNGDSIPVSRLYPIDLPGRGRTLVDSATEEVANAETKKAAAVAAKKGKKKDVPPPPKRLSVPGGLANDTTETHWPDAIFPWSIRAQERADSARLAEVERLRCLERFFERNTDDEDSDSDGDTNESDEEIMPSTQFGELYDDDADRPLPPRRGRGKMIGLPANPDGRPERRRPLKKISALFPSDPSDARAALMAKKNARSLHYRRKRPQKPDNEEIVCVCNGQDDGSELVQCDACEKWYHFHCIGIKSQAELGDDDDLWYCEDCSNAAQVSRASSPETEFQDTSSAQPTFVKDDAPRPKRVIEVGLYQTMAPESPMPAWVARSQKTTGRGRLSSGNGFGSLLGSDRLDIPWAPPHTPGRGPSYRLGGGFDTLDLPATPSRNKLPVSNNFQTPKNSLGGRSSLGSVQFSTPTRSRKILGAPGSLSAVLDDGVALFSPFPRSLDDSPVRRARPSTSSLLETPRPKPTPRYLGHYPVDESPISRSKGKERAIDSE